MSKRANQNAVKPATKTSVKSPHYDENNRLNSSRGKNASQRERPANQKKKTNANLQQGSHKSFSKNHPNAGRWLKKPKQEHQIVLEAVRIANLGLRRAANVEEIATALTFKEKEILKARYSNSIHAIILKILPLLCKRGYIFNAGKSGKRNYFGAVGILDSESVELPDIRSRRQKVLELVERAVQHYGRALRMKDILEYGKAFLDVIAISEQDLVHDVLSLKETGELCIIGSVRGDGRGVNLYLPFGYEFEKYISNAPLTWLEFVVAVFKEIWAEHLEIASRKKRKPLPIITGEVRARIVSSGRYPEKLKDPKLFIAAMQQLSNTDTPSIKKIKRSGQKAVLWIPADINEEDVEIGIAYAHNSERVEEAVRRACQRLGRPVTLVEIEQEAETDDSLQLPSDSKYSRTLADMTKQNVRSGRENERHKSRQRVNWRIHRLGKVSGKAYFHSDNTPEVCAYITYQKLISRWEFLSPEKEISIIEFCTLPTVSIGRMRLLVQEAHAISTELKKLQLLDKIAGVSQEEISLFVTHVREISFRTTEWLSKIEQRYISLPQSVRSEVIGWTAEELLDAIKPFYHRAQKLKPRTSIQAMIGDAIHRLPNPNFKHTSLDNPRLAAEYFYDEVDAKLYIAKQWGGMECRLQATLASNELGLLRDSRFIFPAVESKDYNLRLSAVACLAFLSSEEGNQILHEIASSDADAGVRQSALWANGFTNGTDSVEFIKEREVKDWDHRVRKYAKELLEQHTESWFVF